MQRTGMGRVLVVEDEPDLREMIATRLQGSGYEVMETGNMREAIRQAREFLPEVVLLDIGLPDGSGFDVMEALRAEPEAPSIIFLTALGTTDNRLRGLYGGAIDFLVKPVDLGELVARVAAAMRQRHALLQAQSDAELDALTGLHNRRSFMAALKVELARARRHSRCFAIAYLDADNLKVVNDRYGHAAGDAYLQAIATVLEKMCRENELPARVGGDEFAVLLQEAGAVEAEAFRKRLGAGFSMAAITTTDGSCPVSVSIGSAVFPDDGSTTDAIMAVADRKMYAAKQDHRRT